MSGRKTNATGRASGANYNRQRYKIYGQFLPHRLEMLESPAYRALSRSALRVITRVEIEHLQHAGLDNGRLPVTYDNFVNFGIDRHSIAPAIREAVALGFLLHEEGRAGNAEFRRAARFGLTFLPSRDGPPTDQWKAITTSTQAKELAKRARMPKLRTVVKHDASVAKYRNSVEK